MTENEILRHFRTSGLTKQEMAASLLESIADAAVEISTDLDAPLFKQQAAHDEIGKLHATLTLLFASKTAKELKDFQSAYFGDDPKGLVDSTRQDNP